MLGTVRSMYVLHGLMLLLKVTSSGAWNTARARCTNMIYRCRETRYCSYRSSKEILIRMYAISSDELKENMNRKRKRGQLPLIQQNEETAKEDSEEIMKMEKFTARIAKVATDVADANRKRRVEEMATKTGKTRKTPKNKDEVSTKVKSAKPSGRWIIGGRLAEDHDEAMQTKQNPEADEIDSLDEPEKLITITQLNKLLDKELKNKSYDSDGSPVGRMNDSMTSLLKHNASEGKWAHHYSDATRNVVIVFGKRLVRDQVTVEYASRIRTLASMFKNEDFLPSLVCFCGGKGKGNQVSDADAGYVFFRHMCEAQDISLDGVDIFVDSTSQNDGDAIVSATSRVIQMLPRWLEASPVSVPVNELNRYGQPLPHRKLVNVHFTLVSTEYHLCNLNDVHNRSPSQSLLKPLTELKQLSTQPFLLPDPYAVANTQKSSEYDASSIALLQRAIIKPSFSFQHATYPYIYSHDPGIAYLGKCYILAEKLMPMRLNMKAIIKRKEFFQRDNFLALVSIRRSLVTKVEELHKPPAELSKSLRLSSNSILRKVKGLDKSAVDVVMEGALLSLSRCIDIIRPAGLHTSSISQSEWIKALTLIEYSMSEIRNICDPDRPLKPSEWGKLVDEEVSGNTVQQKINNPSNQSNEVVHLEWKEQLREQITSASREYNPLNYAENSEEDYNPLYNEIVDNLLNSDDDWKNEFSSDDYAYDEADDFDDDITFDDDDNDYPIYDENSVLISLDD